MKKFTMLFLSAVLTISSIISVNAESDKVKVVLNSTELEFDVAPFIQNDRTLVPMRKIFEAVGADVIWDETTNTAFAIREKNGVNSIVSIQINSDTAFINNEPRMLDVAAQLVNDRTFVPLRFVVEALGEKVDWNEDSQTVLITTQE